MAEREREELPAWSLPSGRAESVQPGDWPWPVTPEWAFEDATGAGVRVCILDTGIEADHPRVGAVEEAFVVSARDGETVVEEDTAGDVNGHGTACAGIVRSLAPEAAIASVRVLGEDVTGVGDVLLAGLRFAVERGYDVVSLSLATRMRRFALDLHELADQAYFQRSMLVCSAHNVAVESYPWRFASVVSVGSHEELDTRRHFYNPRPPVEFFARGVNVNVAWLGGTSTHATGNSFATPHLAGLLALIFSKHPRLTPFEVKSALYFTAANVAGTR